MGNFRAHINDDVMLTSQQTRTSVEMTWSENIWPIAKYTMWLSMWNFWSISIVTSQSTFRQMHDMWLSMWLFDVILLWHHNCAAIWRAISLWRHNEEVCQQVWCQAFCERSILQGISYSLAAFVADWGHGCFVAQGHASITHNQHNLYMNL